MMKGTTEPNARGPLLFSVRQTHPIFRPWRKTQTNRKSPSKAQNRKRQVLRRRGPMYSRSGRRWRNCSIPRSIAAKAALAHPPDCSRLRTIPGIAAPAARPPRIARAHRRAGPVRMWRSATPSRSVMHRPPLPLAGSEASEARSRGRGWGERRARCLVAHPPPQPSPARGEGAEKQAMRELRRRRHPAKARR